MCGINGILLKEYSEINNLKYHMPIMNKIIKHRGPDGSGVWVSNEQDLAFGHVRLSIIDLSEGAAQPFQDGHGNVLVFNGEIYNYLELKQKLQGFWQFKTQSDTEVILAAYQKYGVDCVNYFEGMFAFAIWDQNKQRLFLARDRIGIKPLYYYENKQGLFFSSEVKALLPFIDNLEISHTGLAEYFLFQYPLAEDTLFQGVKQLLAGHCIIIEKNKAFSTYKFNVKQYWNVKYRNKYTNLELAQVEFRELMNDVISKHLRSEVAVGSYLSGGVDSSLITILAKQQSAKMNYSVNGRFTEYDNFDESSYAAAITKNRGLNLDIQDINADDFEKNIKNIIYHLDYPVAGPGSFPQYMVSKAASKHVKVMLGGQGGDELFGGYARYLLMYLGDVINYAIDGDLNNLCLQPDPKNILSRLSLLKQYKPLFKQFMQKIVLLLML
jgi:asparagine synthase (glutamine-hydrolysing)